MNSAWEITLDPQQNQPWVWPVTWQSNSCLSTLHLSSQMPGPACYVTENDLTGKTTAGSQSWFYSFKKCYLSCQAQSREQQCAQCPVYSQSSIDANTHARTCTHTHMPPPHTHTSQGDVSPILQGKGSILIRVANFRLQPTCLTVSDCQQLHVIVK